MRKGGGWREFFQPYYPKDYNSLVDEYIAARHAENSDTPEPMAR